MIQAPGERYLLHPEAHAEGRRQLRVGGRRDGAGHARRVQAVVQGLGRPQRPHHRQVLLHHRAGMAKKMSLGCENMLRIRHPFFKA